MPIQSVPDGVLDVENATLRASGMVATKDMVIGKTTKKTSDVPTLEVFSENAATIELQSNLARSTNTSNAFARIKADSQALTFESGSGLAHDSKGDIVFSSVGDATKHMVIKGSTGKIGIGVENPSSALDIAGDINLIGQNAKIKMNSDVLVEHAGPHGRGVAPLKKYPEIVFESGKFDSNDSTNTYVQAGYTVSASSTYSDGTYPAWEAFNGIFIAGHDGSSEGWVSSESPATYSTSLTSGEYLATNVDTFTGAPLGERNGSWIKLKLPKKIKLDHVVLKQRFASQGQEYNKNVVIYASINDSIWQSLGSFDASVSETVIFHTNSTAYYDYFVLHVKSSNREFLVAAVEELEYYGYEEDQPLGDTSVDTTFTSIMNTPQTTGANVYVDAKLSADFTNQVTGPTPVGTAAVHDNTNKYWEMNGQLTSNITVEANTFLEGDQPHAVSMWFNSSNLEANVSNSCIFSLATEEKLDSVNLDLQSNTWHNLTYAYQGEGGSRVTYLDGRKVAEDQAEDTFGKYPPFVMAGYSQGGYVASFSRAHDGVAWHMWGFDETSTGDQYGWTTPFAIGGGGVSSFEVSSGDVRDGGPGIPNLTGTYQGEYAKLELPYKLVLSSIMIRARAGETRSTPREFKVFGSNDDVNWVEILSETGAVPSESADTSFYSAGVQDRGYKYLGLVVNKIQPNNTNGQLSLRTLKLYGHRENDLVRLPDPTNVLKYPHVAMTGPAQRGYVASASSDQSQYNLDVWRMFDGVKAAGNGWASQDGTYYDGTSPANSYTGTTHQLGTGTAYGEWVKLELPHKIKVTKFTLYADLGVSYGTDEAPKSYKIYGSVTGSSWSELKDVSNETPSTGGNSHDVTDTTAYKYLGIVVTQVNTNQNNIRIGELEFYGTGVDSVPIQIGGGNIDKVANFRVYDKFVGEDQALEIWDAQKDEFGRAKSSMTLHKGRLGIGTTEPQGRLAVADEPAPTFEPRWPPKPLVGYNTHIEGYGEFVVYRSGNESTGQYRGDSWYIFDDNQDTFGVTYHGERDINDPINGNYSYFKGTNGEYTGGNSIGGISGDWTVLESPKPIKINDIIRMRVRSAGQSTTGFIIAAANEFDGGWTKLTEQSNLVWQVGGVGESKTFHFANDTYYKYYAIIITQAPAQYGYPTLSNMEFSGIVRRQGQSVLHDGQLTLTKNLTVPRIGPALDADDTPRRDRLVVEYNTSTNPTFEGAVRDTSGRGLDGVFTAGAGYDATEKVLTFNGATTSGVSIGGATGVGGDRPFSVSLWFNASSLTGGVDNTLVGWGAQSNQESFLMTIDTTNNQVLGQFFGNGMSVSPSGGINLGIWYHAVLTYPGGGHYNMSIYVDGVKGTNTNGGTNLGGLVPEDSEITIGTYKNTSNQGFNGKMSSIKLYDTALTAEEVKTLYDMGRCDEGHHMVNFSKTRVGIGLGDGEAPTYTLDVRGQIRSDGSLVTSFTGQHKCIPDEPMEKGLIVSAKKNQFVKLNGLAIGKSAITIDESLPIVSLSNVAQDKACFGVVSSIEEANTTFRVETTNGGVISTIPKTLGDNRAIVNSVGEGAIWVVDTNGPLESGDYITTSNVAGYGQKQDSEFLANYSVAKITMDCDFTGSNVAVQTIKREETGTRIITEDAWNQLVEYDRSSNTETQYSNTLVSSDYSGQSGYTPREVTTIMDYTDGSNLISTAEWSNLESNIQNTYQSNTFTEIVDYTKFVSFSEWSNLTTDVQNTYSEAEITTYYQIQRGENVLDENGQLQFEDKTGATEAPYERRFLDASGAQTDEANAVHIAAFVGCTYHCG